MKTSVLKRFGLFAILVTACASQVSSNDGQGGGGSGAGGQQRAPAPTRAGRLQDGGGGGPLGIGGAVGGSGSVGDSSGGAVGGISGTSSAASSGGACIGSSVLAKLGKARLLVGVSTSDTTAAMAPFDIRYIYISGGLFDSLLPCTACDSSCVASGKACSTSGCAWWGCYDSPPGMYATYFLQAAAKNNQVPMFTYYEILQTAQATLSGFQEGTAEATQAATSTQIMTRYYADWRFLLQQIGQNRAFLHIEPDFWGYARQAGAATAAAAVGSANSTDCESLPRTIGGMGVSALSRWRASTHPTRW